MNRDSKAQIIDELKAKLGGAPFLVLTDFKGSTVAEMNTLRRSFEEKGVDFQVVKNTLAKRAIDGSDMQPLAAFFKGNTGLVFSGEDPSDAAKVLKAQLKDNKNLVVKAGFFEGDVLDEDGVIAIAELPSREQLLSTLLSTIQEGPRQILGVIEAPARDLLYLLSNYATKLEDAG